MQADADTPPAAAGKAEDVAALRLLVEQSRAADVRAAFGAAGKPRALAAVLVDVAAQCFTQRSELATEHLLCLLRALRNLCAGVAAAQDQLHEAGGLTQLAQLLQQLAADAALESRGLLMATALQALGNACVQHSRNQAAVWYGVRSR
jgi:hypothetical protein